ncbi:3-oxoacyl-ACP synthase III family protein [Streptomyces sp. NPDC059680]|uniref:3-oxoacyl-ACP synthase III family protein n=1 Tax=Streptomyces sp. NPDC059680 TaxID=3346904 RepID=UPI0036C5D631
MFSVRKNLKVSPESSGAVRSRLAVALAARAHTYKGEVFLMVRVTAAGSSGATQIGVTGIGAYVPPLVRTYRETAKAVKMSEQWVLERTGIRQRYMAEAEQATSDLAAHAVRSALTSAGLSAEQLDLIIVGTTTPDEICPSTACRVQALVGARRAVALDVSAACSSWLFGIQVARQWLATNDDIEHAVVVGSEVYSRFLDFSDRATASLFGDGAAATVLSRVPRTEGFGLITLASDGTQAEHAFIPGGGSRRPASEATLRERAHAVRMDGRAARMFVYEVFPQMIDQSLSSAGLKPEDIKVVISHQPNPVLLRKAYAKTGLPEERLVVIGGQVGNLGAGSLPYALAQAAAEGRLQPGDKALIVAFGAGLTWGSTILTWSGAAVPDPASFGHVRKRRTPPAVRNTPRP